MSMILIIDDDADLLAKLVSDVRSEFPIDSATVHSWSPSGTDGPALEKLKQVMGGDTSLVVTDYDLSLGRAGILGDSIIRWCQRQAIPAALYTRGNTGDVPVVPDLFELKIPRESAGRYVAELHRGFQSLRESVLETLKQETARSPAAVLALVLGQPDLEHEFARYAVRLGGSSGALTTRVQKTAPADADPPAPEPAEIGQVMSYLLGHLMVNAVLRYAGPLLSLDALCGYIGTSTDESGELEALFTPALYAGPFADLGKFYWRHLIDQRLEEVLSDDTDVNLYTIRRLAVEEILDRKLQTHGCPRCFGQNGGFFCPFTNRPVCERGDCSTASNSWLPPGAHLCRIEMDFFEEWAPLLGF